MSEVFAKRGERKANIRRYLTDEQRSMAKNPPKDGRFGLMSTLSRIGENFMDALTPALREIQSWQSDLVIKFDEPFSKHTSFKVGGTVRAMLFPKKNSEITQLCDLFLRYEITPLVMGKGSNILASDTKHELVVINTTRMNKIAKTGDTEITAEAGALLSEIAVFARDSGLTGAEFAHGIPGTLGGAVVMNAGAYDGEMKDILTATKALNSKSAVYTLTNKQHEFAYRHSRFSDSDDIVLSSVLSLQFGDSDLISRKMEELSKRRKERQPLNLPSAGSTFKRPKEGYAASLIEQAGLKGFTIGGAQISEKHAGFIVNHNNASFDEIIEIIEKTQEAVFKQFNIKLELEVKIIK